MCTLKSEYSGKFIMSSTSEQRKFGLYKNCSTTSDLTGNVVVLI